LDRSEAECECERVFRNEPPALTIRILDEEIFNLYALRRVSQAGSPLTGLGYY